MNEEGKSPKNPKKGKGELPLHDYFLGYEKLRVGTMTPSDKVTVY